MTTRAYHVSSKSCERHGQDHLISARSPYFRRLSGMPHRSYAVRWGKELTRRRFIDVDDSVQGYGLKRVTCDLTRYKVRAWRGLRRTGTALWQSTTLLAIVRTSIMASLTCVGLSTPARGGFNWSASEVVLLWWSRGERKKKQRGRSSLVSEWMSLEMLLLLCAGLLYKCR